MALSTILGLAIMGTISPAIAALKTVQLEFDRVDTFQFPDRNLTRRATSVATELYNAQHDLLYLVNVSVGTPPQVLQLQLDTGSSDTWLPWSNSQACAGRNRRCKEGIYNNKESSTYHLLSANTFMISYVDQTKITGDYFQDTVTIGSAVIPKMTMGLAKNAAEADTTSDFEGILGVGYEQGEAYYAQTGESYPNVVSQLVATGAIHTRAYSLYLNDRTNGVGSILFGGIDTNKYTGPLVSLPIQADSRTKSTASFTVAMDSFRVVDAAGEVAYSKSNLELPVIFDSGTTITYVPDDMAHRLMAGVGAVNSMTYGFVAPCDVGRSNATFEFGFGNSNGPKIVAALSQFVLPFPADVPAPTFKGSGKVACRWGIQAAGSRPNLFGDTFLRGAYVVYNLEGDEIAIAQAKLNSTSPKVVEITGKELPGVTNSAQGSVKNSTSPGNIGPNTILTRPTTTPTSQIGLFGPTGTTFNLGATEGPQGPSGGHRLFGGKKNTASGRTSPSTQLMVALALLIGMIGGGVSVMGMI